jgi:hypothetical protein
MRRVRWFGVLLSVAVVLLGAPEKSSAAAVCESSLPSNIDAGILEPIAIALLQQSPTFQQQCQHIAATIVLRVQVRIAPARHVVGRAQTTIRRYETGALRADVSVEFGSDYVELLAHEFEHVLEQVEQVSLVQQVSIGQAWITAEGSFESRRAIDVGVRARHECELLALEAIEASRRAAPRQRNPFD